MQQERKILIWAVCCLAFHGSFRIHELLSRHEESFDLSTTLLGNNVRHVKTSVGGSIEEFLIIHLKCPKEQQLGKGVNVELFSTGTFSCPVNAWVKWRKLAKFNLEASKPMFRLASGKCLTGAEFNKDIKHLLGRYIDYDHGKYLSHSFRAGMASMMASAGYKDEEIMRQGRWNSRAFLIYCKTGRSSRLREHRDIARKLTENSK